MFQLTKQSAKMTAFNPRPELHGDERVPSADIKFSLTVLAAVLDVFDPRLRQFLYTEDNCVSMPMLGALSWDWKGAGYDLLIHYGGDLLNDGKSDISLKVDIDKFTFVLADGSVEIFFRAQAHPNQEQFGMLCTMIQSDVDVTLTPPKADAGKETPATKKNKGAKDLVDQAKDGGATAAEEGKKDAEDKTAKTEVKPDGAWPFPGTKTADEQSGAKQATAPEAGRTRKPRPVVSDEKMQ